MKRTVWKISILAVFLLFTACETTKMEESKSEYIDGDTIVLKGNPSTGYTWECVESVPGLVKIEETSTYLGDKNVAGASTLFKYKLIPVREGSELLIFMYRRNWEKQAPLQSLQFLVTVKGSKVTIQEN